MRWSYRPSLDGLRALAMYLIVLFHVNLPGTDGAFISVNLFFVLSGYLVTNVVMNEVDRTGTVRLGSFFARRVRRLLPAAVVAIVGICLVFLLVMPLARRLSILGDARSALLYFANWRFIAQADDYFAPSIAQSPFLHFWTLSIEEQFYLAFPVLVLLVIRFFRRRVLIAVLTAVFFASIAAQYYWAGVDANHAYYGTDARIYQLAIGCLLALVLRRWPSPFGRRTAALVGIGGMVAFLVLCTSWLDLSRPTRGVLGTLACAMIICGLMVFEDQRLGRVLSLRVPVYLGMLSYATYLYHWPIIIVIEQTMTVKPWTVAVLSATLATAMAALSAELLEHPVRRSKWLDRWSWPVTLTGLSTSALVAALLVPQVLGSTREPVMNTGATSEQIQRVAKAVGKSEPLPKKVDWRAIDADRGKTYTCDAKHVQRCIVTRGKGPTVVVVGDSHARMLSGMFTAIARKHDWTLAMNDIPNCMWQENLQAAGNGPQSRKDECTRGRVGWYKEVLPKLDPDLVILAELARSSDHTIRQRDGGDRPRGRALLESSRQTVQRIEKAGARVLMIENMIVPETFDPRDCLTSHKHPAACTVPLTVAKTPYNGYFEAVAAESDRAWTVDLNPAFCPSAPLCQPVVNGKVVWRNNHHLTAKYATSRHGQVWKLIRSSGALHGLR